MNTPWGETDRVTVLADGIYDVSTPSHGGIILSTERQDKIPEGTSNFLQDYKYWEDDCDWVVPYILFKDEIGKNGNAYKFNDNLASAYIIAKKYHPEILS